MNNRIEIAYQSLRSSSIDRNIHNVITNFSAEEWIQIIEQKDTFEDKGKYETLIPYLIYTYDEKKIQEIADKSSEQEISFALVDSWYAAVYGNQTEKDLQPTFGDLIRTPILLHTFEGYLLKRIEQADYGEDISSFITVKFKMMLKEYLEALKGKESNKTEAKRVLIGATSGGSAYPPITDYSLDRLESINNFVYFLAALDICVNAFSISGDENYNKELIRQGKLYDLIERNSENVKVRYQNEREFKDAYEYVLLNFEHYIDRFSSYMFNEYEQELLALIFRSSDLALKADIENDDDLKLNLNQFNQDEDDFELEPLHANRHEGENEILPTKESKKEKVTFGEKIKKLLNSLGETDADRDESKIDRQIAKKSEVKKVEVSNSEKYEDTSYDSLVFTAKKKSSNLPLALILASIVGISVLVAVNRGDSEQSIIDKSQSISGAEKQSEFRTIIER
ncbi:hypothetical protein QTV49_000284 [Vibrio vulnificus]|nr:hypothetical protein [Vibrio vulnificus]